MASNETQRVRSIHAPLLCTDESKVSSGEQLSYSYIAGR